MSLESGSELRFFCLEIMSINLEIFSEAAMRGSVFFSALPVVV